MSDIPTRTGTGASPQPPLEETTSETLKADWELLRGRNIPDPDPTFPDRNPGDFVLGTSTGRILLKITTAGRVQLGPGVDLDEASELFWTNLALKRQDMEARLLHFDMMEQLLLQVADADRAYERAQLRARRPEATAHDQQTEELSRRSLEVRVHGMLEYARGLRRPLPDPEGTPR